MSQRKDLHKLIRDVKAQGWRVEHTGRNHLAFRSPQGGTVYTCIHAVGLSRNEEHTEDAETLRLARVNCSAKPNSCP